jgi:putative tricarboxylic transport membrane protein
MKGLGPAARDVVPYAVLLIAASYLFHRALGIRFDAGGHPGPAFWPKMALGFLIAGCVVGIVQSIHQSWRERRRSWAGPTIFFSDRDHPDPTETSETSKLYPWIAIALTTAYVGLLPQVGFFVATAVYVAALIYLGNYRRAWIAALVGLSASVAFVIVFMKIVYVSLPIGAGAFEQVSTFVMATLGIR